MRMRTAAITLHLLTTVVVAVLTTVASVSLAMAQPAAIASNEAHTLVSKGKLLLIDIRTAEDRQRTGIAKGAVTLDRSLPLDVFIASVKRLTHGKRDARIALVCAAGVWSSEMQTNLEVAGYTRVFNVVDGMEGNDRGRGWLANGLPVRSWPSKRVERR